MHKAGLMESTGKKSVKSSEGTTGDILLLFLECQQFQFLK